MFSSLILLIPLLLAMFALAPAFMLGRAHRHHKQRRMAALVVAVALNLLFFTMISRMSYLGVIGIPFACFCIAAAVAGVVGYRGWLIGFLASFWFIAPVVYAWFQTATPDQITAYGCVPWEMIFLTIPFSAAGAIAAEIALTIGTLVKREPRVLS